MFVGRWAQIAQRRMAPFPVVPRFEIPEDPASGFVPRVPVMLHEQFKLERREKALGHGVVVTVALAAHAGNDSVRRQLRPIVSRRVLAAAIRVVNQSG